MIRAHIYVSYDGTMFHTKWARAAHRPIPSPSYLRPEPIRPISLLRLSLRRLLD